MAENIIIGSRVRAIDELGRWEAAKVKEIGFDKNEILVVFPGWNSDWDRWVNRQEIRHPVSPIEEQRRRE